MYMIITFSSKLQIVALLLNYHDLPLKMLILHMLMILLLRVANGACMAKRGGRKATMKGRQGVLTEACERRRGVHGVRMGCHGWGREEECLGPWAWQGRRGCRGSHLGQRYYPSRTDQPGTILGLLHARPMGSDCAGASLSHTPNLIVGSAPD